MCYPHIARALPAHCPHTTRTLPTRDPRMAAHDPHTSRTYVWGCCLLSGKVRFYNKEPK